MAHHSSWVTCVYRGTKTYNTVLEENMINTNVNYERIKLAFMSYTDDTNRWSAFAFVFIYIYIYICSYMYICIYTHAFGPFYCWLLFRKDNPWRMRSNEFSGGVRDLWILELSKLYCTCMHRLKSYESFKFACVISNTSCILSLCRTLICYARCSINVLFVLIDSDLSIFIL